MKLFYSVNSPYARKCRILVYEKGLESRVEFVDTPPLDNPAELLAVNPLARVPALLTDEGMALMESSLICDYLDSLTPSPKFIPKEGTERYLVLGITAMTDGVLDAAVQCVLENRKAEGHRSQEWIERKETSIIRTLDLLANHPPEQGLLNMAMVGLGVTLEYVGFRLPHLSWQSRYPQLAEWLSVFSQRPSMQKTRPGT